MSLQGQFLRKAAWAAENPEDAMLEMEQLNIDADEAIGWISDHIDAGEPEPAFKISNGIKAALCRLMVAQPPFLELMNCINCAIDIAVWKAYEQGRREALAELVLVPEETKAR